MIQIKVANIKIQSLMCVSMYVYITKKKKKLREVSSPYSVSEKLRMGNRRRKQGANNERGLESSAHAAFRLIARFK